MRLIKEPIGIDFIIQSKPLTDIERKEISEYIKMKKEQNKTLKIKKLFVNQKLRHRKWSWLSRNWIFLCRQKKSEKIEQLYESRLKDKDAMIAKLKKIIEKLTP